MFDVELPVGIKVAGEADGSELDDGFSHLLGPAHAGTLHPVFDQVFARTFDRATGDRPAVGEIFVIAHAGAVSVKVIGDSPQRFARGPGQAAFGDTLTNPLDDLADITEQDSQSAVEDPEFGLQAALGMEDIGGFLQFLQSVHQVQNQGDSQLPVDSNL